MDRAVNLYVRERFVATVTAPPDVAFSIVLYQGHYYLMDTRDSGRAVAAWQADSSQLVAAFDLPPAGPPPPPPPPLGPGS